MTSHRFSGVTSRLAHWRPVTLVVTSVIATVVCAALVMVATSFAGSAASDRDRVAARAELSDTAGQQLAAVFSVNAADWQDQRAQARTLVTDAFAATFAAQFDRPPPSDTAAVRWEPRAVGVIAVTGERAALRGDVAIDALVNTEFVGGQERTQPRSVRATFLQVDGHWLVNRVVVLR